MDTPDWINEVPAPTHVHAFRWTIEHHGLHQITDHSSEQAAVAYARQWSRKTSGMLAVVIIENGSRREGPRFEGGKRLSETKG